MIGLIMAGGRGHRMNLPIEKLLLELDKPVILHVFDAMKNSGKFKQIIAATSKHSPNTALVLEKNQIKTIQTLGKGYSADLNFIIKQSDETFFVVSGDMPLLDEDIIQKIIQSSNSDHIWNTFVITESFANSLGIKSEYTVMCKNQTCLFTGISIIDSAKISNLEKIPEYYNIIDDKRIALNLNTVKDFDLIKSL